MNSSPKNIYIYLQKKKNIYIYIYMNMIGNYIIGPQIIYTNNNNDQAKPQ